MKRGRLAPASASDSTRLATSPLGVRSTLSEWMESEGVPGLEGIDTRALTKLIRANPSLLGRIETPGNIGAVGTAFTDPNEKVLQERVSTKEVREYGVGDTHIVVVDCGVKNNILRELLTRNTRLSVVPYDYDYTKMEYDGLFISNGPGDPRLLTTTVETLRKAMDEKTTPVFGICMGNQIMGLAAGGQIVKMAFGNRGHNQPVMNILSHRSYITSQNHGFAVETDNLPDEWAPLFTNLNDGTNEGLIHKSKPYSSAQFHPEARGGPNDTLYFFDQFVAQCRQYQKGRPISNFYKYPQLKTPEKVLVLGSGGLQIGQAGEFDYSGSQAIKSFNAMGIETVLINPNIATIQTSRGLADTVYYEPATVEFVTQIIAKERPDAIALSFGGQTALNVGVALHDSGVLREYAIPSYHPWRLVACHPSMPPLATRRMPSLHTALGDSSHAIPSYRPWRLVACPPHHTYLGATWQVRRRGARHIHRLD